jgi:TPR repeat protein
VKVLQPLVDQGNADAQDILAIMYYVGQGVAQNRAEAIRLYRLAAEQGNAHAQDALGFAYQNGVGLQRTSVKRRSGFARPPIRTISMRSSISARCMNWAMECRKIMCSPICGSRSLLHMVRGPTRCAV